MCSFKLALSSLLCSAVVNRRLLVVRTVRRVSMMTELEMKKMRMMKRLLLLVRLISSPYNVSKSDLL